MKALHICLTDLLPIRCHLCFDSIMISKFIDHLCASRPTDNHSFKELPEVHK